MQNKHITLTQSIIIIIFIGYTLAMSRISSDALWYDEVISYYMVGAAQFEPLLPPADFLERIILTDRWPPLYYMSLTGWSQLAGWSVFSGRFLSVLLGSLTIAITYQLGKTVHKALTGFIAAAMLATSTFFIYFMHEIRGYTMYPLFFVLTLLLYWRIIHYKQIKPLTALAFVLSICAALYTHLANYPLIFALGLYHLIFARHLKVWLTVLILFGISASGVLPWLVIIFYKIGQGMSIGQTSNWFIFQEFLPSFGNGLGIFLLIAMLHGLLTLKNAGMRYIGFILLAGFGANVVINMQSPFLFHMRHLIGILPLAIVLAAAGITHFSRQFPRLAVIPLVLWIGAGILNTYNANHILSWEGQEPTLKTSTINTLVSVSETCIGNNDRVILHLGEPISRGEVWEWINDVVMVYYWRNVQFQYAHISTLQPITNNNPMGIRPRVQLSDEARLVPKMARFIDDAENVWHFQLKRLPEIFQTELLKAVLVDKGYLTSVQIIDTPTLSGWVYSKTANIPDCTIEGN